MSVALVQQQKVAMKNRSFKVTVCFESRPDGGLRAWSDDVPGLVLSHTNIDGVLEDVTEALSVILSHQFNTQIDVKPLGNLREMLEENGIVAPRGFVPGPKEYVATVH
ncbi:hypothetical protein J6500_04945 [Bradyrhizobium sp. WSM 1704]|uniref:hypothetical protein n=1 Tax=Bradyrhizobium semiaridum TaxID=2821404 RepID=UPI001CE25230|nr:hypothetical protein [Bradyrhizobium semiaridum]MCA6121254.1 hypothetical protein [Bradyrhizobium semiaridum]